MSKIPSKPANNFPKRGKTSLNGAKLSKWFIDAVSVDQNQPISHLLGNWQNLSPYWASPAGTHQYQDRLIFAFRFFPNKEGYDEQLHPPNWSGNSN